MKTILELKGLSKFYHGVIALDKVSCSFGEGEIHALIGENGAGKSTLIKSVSGAIQFDEGSIVINGKEFTSMTPDQALDAGVAVIYQEFCLVPSMNVAENIFIGQQVGSKYLADIPQMHQKAQEIFEKLGAKIDTHAMVNTLSTAQQQLVEIAKAVSRNAKVLFMDEPSATLAMQEVQAMFGIMRTLKEQGVTIIYVSHRLDEIFEICDRVTVMRDGKYVSTSDIKDITRQQLINAMVGRQLDSACPPRNAKIGDVALEVKDLMGNGDYNIDLAVHHGEVLGIAGLVGSGRSEFAKVLYGAVPKDGGHIYVEGKEVEINSPSQAIELGIGLIPEDRKTEGILLEYPIDWNISLMILKKLSNHMVINMQAVKETVEKYFKRMRIKAPSTQNLVKSLSGGNQQKVVVAKTLAAETKIIIFDEPTRGIDVGAKQEIYQLMNELVEEGNAIIMISSDMEEVLGMSDRIVVFHEGTVAGELEKKDFSQANVMSLASGL
ncbi:MAG: sugar ABC transporter ATP-binding protein [Firmicutes bacterium]|nr:sugar ABC transporter ATP-binding protein [Bacillota bacterium]